MADAVTVVPGGEAVLETNLITPGVIGWHMTATIYVEYANTGTIAHAGTAAGPLRELPKARKGRSSLSTSPLSRTGSGHRPNRKVSRTVFSS